VLSFRLSSYVIPAEAGIQADFLLLCYSVEKRNPGSGFRIQNADLDPCLRRDDGEKKDDGEGAERRHPLMSFLVSPLLSFQRKLESRLTSSSSVIPLKNGIQVQDSEYKMQTWIPAFAGMTQRGIVIPSEDGIQVLSLFMKYRIQNADLDPRFRGDDNFLTFEK